MRPQVAGETEVGTATSDSLPLLPPALSAAKGKPPWRIDATKAELRPGEPMVREGDPLIGDDRFASLLKTKASKMYSTELTHTFSNISCRVGNIRPTKYLSQPSPLFIFLRPNTCTRTVASLLSGHVFVFEFAAKLKPQHVLV